MPMCASTAGSRADPDDLLIVIDGPAGSGKSTVARLLAVKLGARLLETGALYRCVALKALRGKVPVDRPAEVGRVARELNVRIESDPSGRGMLVFLDGEDVTAELRGPQVGRNASVVAAIPTVREALMELQRRLARGGVTVAEGRDLGTVVFPEARVKFFLVADPEVRAERRYLEHQSGGDQTSLDQVRGDIAARDARDQKRAVAPMRPADDAVVVDTGGLDPDGVVEAIMAELARRNVIG